VQDAHEVLKTLGLSPVASLSQAEVSTLSIGLFPAVGAAALEAYGIWSLMQLSDAVAAVSCEVYKVNGWQRVYALPGRKGRIKRPLVMCLAQVFTEPYQSVHFDICRPHRGQMASPSNLSLCLEGSSLVNTRKADKHDPKAFRCIPQVDSLWYG